MLIRVETTSETSSPAIRLSKSKFLSGLQCHKRLYLEVHAPELATEPDDATQAILDMGTEIGALARQRFPGGVMVEAGRRHSAYALQHTQGLIQDPTVSAIFEGAFAFDQILVRVDILERVISPSDAGATWRLIEVKSSTKVKEVHVDDLAIQTHVLAGTGVALAESCLMHINTQYVFGGGDIDLGQLFAITPTPARSGTIAPKTSPSAGSIICRVTIACYDTYPNRESKRSTTSRPVSVCPFFNVGCGTMWNGSATG
jgi:hypothetical protein